jgi:hypothetical protein
VRLSQILSAGHYGNDSWEKRGVLPAQVSSRSLSHLAEVSEQYVPYYRQMGEKF